MADLELDDVLDEADRRRPRSRESTWRRERRRRPGGRLAGRLRARRRGSGGGLARGPRGSASRAAAGALRIGRAVGAALTEQRTLARTEARLVAIVGLALLALGVAIVWWPLVAAVPAALTLLWLALALFAKARALFAERRRQGLPPTRVVGASPHERED